MLLKTKSPNNCLDNFIQWTKYTVYTVLTVHKKKTIDKLQQVLSNISTLALILTQQVKQGVYN